MLKLESQLLISPCVSHWHAVVWNLRYIKGLAGKGLNYTNRGHTDIVGSLDMNWAGDASDQCLSSGYCVFAESRGRVLMPSQVHS